MPQPWSWLAEGKDSHNSPLDSIIQWIGLRENVQETIVFLPLNSGFSCKFSPKPIHWIMSL